MILQNKEMEKAVATKKTKPQTKQTLQEKLSEIDWDLLEELDLQEEGQHLPMQDYVSKHEHENTETTDSSSKKLGKLRQKIMIDPKQFPKLK
tara:strand:+ start:142 stop:417 length:276 start_codon:yes stop_codon:yes gene_type:complete